jgi:3'-5' exoribonuclease
VTDEGRLLGHVELGLRLVEERGRSVGLDDARRLALAHCVLTHHGADAAPGRRFGSAEALALHRLNALDAAVKGALEHGLP